jgi:threonine/homoserine/homoserine lactone efflux protein
MPDSAHWSLFLGATVVLLLIPGPSVIYVVTQGIYHGYRGAVLSSAGLALGDLLQVLCTAAGISVLLASSGALFLALKYAGAVYLIILGFFRLLGKDTSQSETAPGDEAAKTSSRSLVIQAFFALNPKTGLFFLALFPQFIAQNAGPAWLQILLFGCAFVSLGFVTNFMYGAMAGKVSRLFTHSDRFRNSARYASAVTLIGLGLLAAIAPTAHRLAG